MSLKAPVDRLKTPRRLRRPARLLAAVLALAAAGATSPWGRASCRDETLEPNGRGLQLLGGREAILLEQSERAREAARTRALILYRLLRTAAVERGVAGPATGGDAGRRVDARAVALATTVLGRDLDEARALKAELDRVRAERASLRDAPEERAATDATSPRSQAPTSAPATAFLRPVTGSVLTPFGVGRDTATGAWIFRAAASFAAAPDEPVRSPADGRVVRVAGSLAGGAAVVLACVEDRWTFVMSGLGSVAVSPGEIVRRGDPVGRVPGGPGSALRIEAWHGRAPVDPVAVLRLR